MGAVTVTFTSSLDLDEVWVYTRSNRSGLSFNTVINGGDDKLTLAVPCDDLNLPPEGSVVRVWTDETGFSTYPIWMGRLHVKRFHIEKKVVKSINLECMGYYHEGDTETSRKFLTDQVYGPASTGSSPLTSKTVTTDIRDAFSHACNQLMPDVQVLLSELAVTGINLTHDTQAYNGQSAVEVFNFLAAITGYLSTPLVWEIKQRLGIPTLHAWSVDTSPTYYDDGESNQDLTYELAARANRVTVEWGNNQRWTSPTDDGDPLSYVAFQGLAILQDKYVTSGKEVVSLLEVQELGRGYLRKFNVRRPNGTVEFTAPLRSSLGYHPLEVIRAGTIIRCELSQDFLLNNEGDNTGGPLDQLHTDRYMIDVRYEESDKECKLVCTYGEVGDLYREIRRLMTVPNKFITWDTAFGAFGRPVPEMDKAPVLGSQYVSAPNTVGSPFVEAVIPMAAMSNGTQSFGTVGGQVIPDILPDNFSELPVVLRTADGSTIPVNALVPIIKIPITKNYKLNTWRAVSIQIGDITILFKKNDVTFATIVITTDDEGSGTFTETTLTTGDIVSVFVTANTTIANVTANVSGNKHWPQFPQYPVPGP